MTRGLIDYLTYAYSYLHKGRGILRADDMQAIRAGTRTMVKTAPAVLANETDTDLTTVLAEAKLIEQHIEESVDWLLTLEIS